jgi:hypothetical protein
MNGSILNCISGVFGFPVGVQVRKDNLEFLSVLFSWWQIPDGQLTGLTFSLVKAKPSGAAVRNYFLTADHQEKILFPVDLFLSAYSWRLPVRNCTPDGFSVFHDGFWPSGKTSDLVVVAIRCCAHTTGQRSLAEGLPLCRESNIGRSAKNPLPRASARQRLALGKASFAESSTLGTNRTSAKPQPRKRPTYAVIFAESQLLGSWQNIFLCREHQPRLSAKKNSDFCSQIFCAALLQY